MNKLTKLFTLLSLVGIMSIGGWAFVLAAHTQTPSITPALTKGSTSTTFTINVAIGGADSVDYVRITKPTEYSALSCGAAPADWALDLSSETQCAYTTVTAPIASGANKDFTVTATTASSSGTYTWGVLTRDLALTAVSQTDTTDVDAVVPTISLVTVDTATVKDGDLTQLVTIDFSETMGVTVPTITFGAGTWTPSGAGSWTDGDTYADTFTLTDNAEEAADVDITISGAKDAAGNTMAEDSASGVDKFDIDTKNPTATVTVSVDPIYEGGLVQTVTVTYDEAMNPATSPVIILTGTHWGAQTPVGWSGVNTIYTATFTQDGTAERIAAETATVANASGATDANGNAEVGDASPAFVVDTQKPTVTTITPTDLAEADAGTVDVVITFGENMDQATAPTIQVAGITGSPIAVTGAYTSATQWDGTFTFADNNEEVTNAYYTVSGAKDVAGNTITALAARGANNPLDVDTVKPTVANVTATTADGYYNAGDTVAVTVTFSSIVNVTGTPRIELETGDTNRYATYASGTGGVTLTFNYTVQAGDTSADLDYAGTDSLTLNDGTIKDVAGNNATLTLATPGAAGSLGANKAIVIDTTQPTVALTYNPNRALMGLESVIITATFTDTNNISEVVVPTIAIATSGDGSLTATSMTKTSNKVWTYTWQVPGGVDDEGTATVAIAATDVAGNVNATATNNTRTIDTIAPTITSVTLDKEQYRIGQDTAVVVTVVEDNTAATVTVNGEAAVESPAGTWTGAFNHGKLAAGTYSFNVVATDANGNARTQLIQYRVVAAGDTTAPGFVEQAPGDGDTDVSINPEELYVEYDESLDPNTINSTNVKLCLAGEDDSCSTVSVGSPMLSEGGKRIMIGGPGVTLSYGTTYWIKIENVKNLAGISVASYGSKTTSEFTTVAQPKGSLQIDNVRINPDKSIATNNNDFANGWEWFVSLTVPTDNPRIRLQFTDFTGSGGTSIPAGSNIQYYSEQDTNSHSTENTAVGVGAVKTYPGDYLIFNGAGDQNSTADGYQVVVRVQVKVPSSATGNSYSGQFKVEASSD